MSQWPSAKARTVLAALLHIDGLLSEKLPVPTAFFHGLDGLTLSLPFMMVLK
jgi:hypothetical protein